MHRKEGGKRVGIPFSRIQSDEACDSLIWSKLEWVQNARWTQQLRLTHRSCGYAERDNFHLILGISCAKNADHAVVMDSRSILIAQSRRVRFGPCGSEISCGAAQLKFELIREFSWFTPHFSKPRFFDRGMFDLGNGAAIVSTHEHGNACGAAQIDTSRFMGKCEQALVMANYLGDYRLSISLAFWGPPALTIFYNEHLIW
jgi:hypothetical protein